MSTSILHIVKYKSCIDPEVNKISTLLDKISPVYLIGTLRYSHKEYDNIICV
ncbi:hypothetical protein H8356DRAFT_1649555 [Neocallimastix lanati (nom. inval.)]|uniref:Uncharacterized protein n=1 Tax=Neocallimastix californiae TaxID=1754190 RepID=A0A1Y2AFS2_9FUNG|nr:hypothetical protein H8356DRAFT_1649555 [Neocallimastix sp. JGI-2020a]ORY21120.1 hypothetical protein LY90DRAFT_145192 [Neocallimastix californiae]|eukprot:ORY21120.1 hypothetical protein LY90DRAFT_145192 [Neocallimastix californiae]